MGIRSKTLVTIFLVGIVIGAYSLSTSNKYLFKGEIKKNISPTTQVGEPQEKPDLTAELEILIPENPESDVSANVTIINKGPGIIKGDNQFRYAVYLNDQEVFSNTDFYTSMNSGDNFSFAYPISRLIYKYGKTGKISVVIDTDKSIEEIDENNNKIEKDF